MMCCSEPFFMRRPYMAISLHCLLPKVRTGIIDKKTSLLTLKTKVMKEQIDPEKVKKAIQVTIYILTAILGFFTGGGVQAATAWL